MFLILLGFIGVLLYIIRFWRRKAGDAAFAAACKADSEEERDRYCRLAIMAGHKDACSMFCLPILTGSWISNRSSHSSLTAFGWFSTDIITRPGTILLNDEQRAFCRSIYQFKQGERHGIEFFKACMTALQADEKSYHIMFMPCSNWIKYTQRFKRLDWYIGKHRPELTSGLYDVDVFDVRESLHEAKGGENRILERNYEIVGNIKGKEIIIIDDILTTGESLADYKGEIERCGGKVVAAIFYGKTFSIPPLFFIKLSVWRDYIACIGRR